MVSFDDYNGYGIFATKRFRKGAVILDIGSATLQCIDVMKLVLEPEERIRYNFCPEYREPARHLHEFVACGDVLGGKLDNNENACLSFIDLVDSMSPVMFLNSCSEVRKTVDNVRFALRSDLSLYLKASRTINKYTEILEDYWDNRPDVISTK